MPTVRRIWLNINRQEKRAWENLLTQANLAVDTQVDQVYGVFEQDRLLATGSLLGSIIKCVAVDESVRSENLLAPLMQTLFEALDDNGSQHAFIYTKPDKVATFHSLGFKLLVQTDLVALLERGYPDFSDYQTLLKSVKREGIASAIVMNANPFTRGHRYLVEQAAALSDVVYLFVVSEARSLFSPSDRLNMVRLGTADLANVVVVPTRDYMVSAATFPSYFLKDRADLAVARQQAALDATLFSTQIAPLLNIQARFVGEEPLSPVTDVYNQALKAAFAGNIALHILPRKQVGGEVISATRVRAQLKESGTVDETLVMPAIANYIKEHSHAN